MTHALRWFLHISFLLWAAVLFTSPSQAQQVCPTGYPRTTPDSDFTDAGNGMVQHTPTGLIWKRCAEGQSWDGTTCTGTAATYTWQQVFERADAVNANTAGTENQGQTDWRVPNINELKSLVEQGCTIPAINSTQFPNTPASLFWSASPLAGNSVNAWYVNFGYGFDFWDLRSFAFHVRLVRAGQFFYNFDAALGTVTVGKTLAGAAAGSVPAGTQFPITLTCGATTLGPINATNATPAQFTNVPPGSCTVSEGTLPTVTGVTWGTPSYNPANPITVTAGADTAVTVTNTADVTTYAITATASPAAGGTVSCSPNPVNHGSDASCTAIPNTGYSFSGWSGDCTGTGSCSFSNVTAAKAVTASFSAAAQKAYTGPTATGTGNATATLTGGGDACGFSEASFVPLSSVATAPPVGYSFPHGLFKFTLTQCTVGGTITLSIRYPTILPTGTTYWKFGLTAAQAEHWYLYSSAAINGDTVTFSITDGGLGDNDLKADGTISDPSGPAIPTAPATDVPTLSEWAALILFSLLLGIGGWILRQRQTF